MPEPSLAGKTFIVTAAAAGISFTTTKLLLESGANVGMSGKDGEALGLAVANFDPQVNSRILTGVVDVSSRFDIRAFIHQTRNYFNGLDGITSVAGVAGRRFGAQNVWEIPEDEYDYTLIESPQEHSNSTPSTGGKTSDTMTGLEFFYFGKQHPYQSSCSAALRALCAQLLHKMSPTDPDALDAFLILRANDTTGQFIASDNEIFAALLLLIGRLGKRFLIIDGVDECADLDIFLERLVTICNSPTFTSIAMFSRSTVFLPPRLIDKTIALALDKSCNL
jgi:hypothetical protein